MCSHLRTIGLRMILLLTFTCFVTFLLKSIFPFIDLPLNMFLLIYWGLLRKIGEILQTPGAL